MANNPMLDELRSIPRAEYPWSRTKYATYSRHGANYKFHRDHFVKEYSWAIPHHDALNRIAQFAPSICEIGAGTGYWAYMLSQYGCSIVAYDIAVPGKDKNEYRHERTWFNVQRGDILSINQHQNRTLMMCWPPYSETMSHALLSLYEGPQVVYIGEGHGGCTGSEEFHDLLDAHFNEVECLEIPQWDGIHDSVYLYKRK